MKELKTYRGSCDASGVVPLGAGHFASGTDEANRVSIHPLAGNGEPSAILELDGFLGATWKEKKKKFAECDFESATRLGNLTLWITSHGRDKKGEEEPDRHRFFALEITTDGVGLEPFGVPYRGLLKDLLSAAFPEEWRLGEAASKAPQSQDGLNIEALCATPDGSVWIGFRNPVPQGLAILAELLDPLALLSGDGTTAEFGRFVSLDLGGRGIRDMFACDGGFLILAGAFDDHQRFALFQWDGENGPPVPVSLDPAEGGLNPEGLLLFPDTPGTLHIFSDDDSLMIGATENKELPPEKQTFRAMSTAWPPTHA